jgi:hypothetical protein
VRPGSRTKVSVSPVLTHTLPGWAHVSATGPTGLASMAIFAVSFVSKLATGKLTAPTARRDRRGDNSIFRCTFSWRGNQAARGLGGAGDAVLAQLRIAFWTERHESMDRCTVFELGFNRERALQDLQPLIHAD